MVETPLRLSPFSPLSFCSYSNLNSTAAVSFVIANETGQLTATTSTAKRLSRNENEGLSNLKS